MCENVSKNFVNYKNMCFLIAFRFNLGERLLILKQSVAAPPPLDVLKFEETRAKF